VGKVLADDVAAGGAKDIADKEDIHLKILHGRSGPQRRDVCAGVGLRRWERRWKVWPEKRVSPLRASVDMTSVTKFV